MGIIVCYLVISSVSSLSAAAIWLVAEKYGAEIPQFMAAIALGSLLSVWVTLAASPLLH